MVLPATVQLSAFQLLRLIATDASPKQILYVLLILPLSPFLLLLFLFCLFYGFTWFMKTQCSTLSSALFLHSFEYPSFDCCWERIWECNTFAFKFLPRTMQSYTVLDYRFCQISTYLDPHYSSLGLCRENPCYKIQCKEEFQGKW